MSNCQWMKLSPSNKEKWRKSFNKFVYYLTTVNFSCSVKKAKLKKYRYEPCHIYFTDGYFLNKPMFISLQTRELIGNISILQTDRQIWQRTDTRGGGVHVRLTSRHYCFYPVPNPPPLVIQIYIMKEVRTILICVGLKVQISIYLNVIYPYHDWELKVHISLYSINSKNHNDPQ